MRVKNADFAAKFEEWYINNPDECCGEMNFTNDANDIQLSARRHSRMLHRGYGIFMNVFCVLAGLIIILMNVMFYINSLMDFDLYYSDTTFLLVTVLGLLVALLPVRDAVVKRMVLKRRINDMLSSGSVGLNCGCRFYNSRVEFISAREHTVYRVDDIENIYECADGLYFMMYSGDFRYIPSRFFDNQFAYDITERLSVVCFDKYIRRGYMQVPPVAAPMPDFETPAVEEDSPLFEFSYIIDRPSAKKFTRCGRMKLGEAVQLAAMIILGGVLVYMIFFRELGTALNWGILILDIIYVAICVTLHLSGVELECERYSGKYIMRFFDRHVAAVSGSSAVKINYEGIRETERRSDCIIFKTRQIGGTGSFILPYYAVENIEEFTNFLQIKGICNS